MLHYKCWTPIYGFEIAIFLSCPSLILSFWELNICNRGLPDGSMVNKPFAMQGARVQSLGQEDPLEEEMVTHSSILAWKISWAEEPCWLWGHKCQTWLSTHTLHCSLLSATTSKDKHHTFISYMFIIIYFEIFKTRGNRKFPWGHKYTYWI